ncbi:MAG: transposase [Gammaproteobacteria bacterium RBG_16_66_13]|nr:MAG: transposase [Gammaproteobacteria bacterium RBG_16_66_13]
MRRSRFTDERIVAALKEHEAGVSTQELCRRLGISQETLYRWKRKYGGLEVSDARRLRELEEENRRLKRLVAEQALDVLALKDVLSKNFGRPPSGGKS